MCKRVQDHSKLPETAKRSTPIVDFGRTGVAHPSLRVEGHPQAKSYRSPKGSKDCVTIRGSPLEIWEWIRRWSCTSLWSGAKSCPRPLLVTTLACLQLFSHSDQVLLKGLTHTRKSPLMVVVLQLNCPAEDHLRLVGKGYNMHESSSV